MNVGAPASGTREAAADRAAWCYASGRVAVLEPMLLARGFFESLAECRTHAEARAALSRTLYRAAFTDDASVGDYSESVERSWRAAGSDILSYCPEHAIAAAWRLPGRYFAARSAFLRRAAESAGPESLAETLATVASEGQGRAALARHVEAARSRAYLGDAAATSLLVDSAARAVQWALAQAAGEPLVRSLMRDSAALGVWSSVVRARWNGVAVETVRRWFLVQPELQALVEAAAVRSDDHAARALAGFVSDRAADRITDLPREALRRDLEGAVAACLREGVVECRRVAFGPERVLSYLVALDAERANLALALAAVVRNLDRTVVKARLREGYA